MASFVLMCIYVEDNYRAKCVYHVVADTVGDKGT